MAKEPEQPEQQIFFGDVPTHDLFQKQIQQVLEQADLDEDSKQAILVALNCPCCGAGGMNYTAKVNRKKKPGPVI
jgi:hypothetical protein